MKKRLKNLLDKDLYTEAKKALANEDFVHNNSVKTYVEFYELMSPMNEWSKK